jgi:hypothetical protein
MPNTITQTTTVLGLNKVVRHIGITSDGSEETDLVIYDSSAIASSLGIDDPLNCRILSVHYSVASAAFVGLLEFDATTDTHALALPAYSAGAIHLRDVGGIPNTAGSGKTGDILLTTTGLAPGDAITLVLEVAPR